MTPVSTFRRTTRPIVVLLMALAHNDTVWLDVALAPRESEGSAP